MLGLAQRGLVPKVFWRRTPEVVAILDGARRVAAAAGARAETAKAFAVRLSAASAGAPHDADKQPWGADKWMCPHCGLQIRRSNKSIHLKHCKMAPTAPQMNRSKMNRSTRKRCLKKPNRAARCR